MSTRSWNLAKKWLTRCRPIMVVYDMLSRQITFPCLPTHANSFIPILLQILRRSCRHQLLWNQPNPNSLRKIPGPGSSALRPLGALCASLPKVALSLASLSPLCFHNLTNCFSRKLFVFKTIRIAGGVGSWGNVMARVILSFRGAAAEKSRPTARPSDTTCGGALGNSR